jgi:hypothetical protein
LVGAVGAAADVYVVAVTETGRVTPDEGDGIARTDYEDPVVEDLENSAVSENGSSGGLLERIDVWFGS